MAPWKKAKWPTQLCDLTWREGRNQTPIRVRYTKISKILKNTKKCIVEIAESTQVEKKCEKTRKRWIFKETHERKISWGEEGENRKIHVFHMYKEK